MVFVLRSGGDEERDGESKVLRFCDAPETILPETSWCVDVEHKTVDASVLGAIVVSWLALEGIVWVVCAPVGAVGAAVSMRGVVVFALDSEQHERYGFPCTYVGVQHSRWERERLCSWHTVPWVGNGLWEVRNLGKVFLALPCARCVSFYVYRWIGHCLWYSYVVYLSTLYSLLVCVCVCA